MHTIKTTQQQQREPDSTAAIAITGVPLPPTALPPTPSSDATSGELGDLLGDTLKDVLGIDVAPKPVGEADGDADGDLLGDAADGNTVGSRLGGDA